MLSKLSVYFCVFLYVLGEDLPCAPRQMDYGFVCVCNSTYCDTVERPEQLPKDQYYLYVTGQLSPGFTRSSGKFQTSQSDNSGIVFNINSDVRYQEILGFGGSFTDSSGIVIDSLPQAAQDRLLESYFGEKGVEYSVGRVAMGGSDFSTRIYTYADTPDSRDLKHFSLQQEDFLYKIPLIKKAMSLSPHEQLRLVASPFSAPLWMKVNGKYESGYIKRQQMDAWANYFVKFFDSYEEHGIKFWLVTESNECALPYPTGPLPIGNLGWPMTDAYFLKAHLAPQLRASNHSYIKYLAVDDQRPFAQYWMKKFTSDQFVSDMLGGVALHWYSDWEYPSTLLDTLHETYPDKLIVYSESSVNDLLFSGISVQLGDWDRGSLYFYNIIDNFNHWTNAYLDWNLALDTNGGPYLDLAIDAAIIVNSTSGEFYKNPMFYAMGTYSKFMPPGAYRVNVTSNLNSTENNNPPTPAPLPTFLPVPKPVTPKTVHCLATVNPDNSTTVVLFNAMDEQADVTVVDATAGHITTTIPAQTLHTFIYWPQR